MSEGRFFFFFPISSFSPSSAPPPPPPPPAAPKESLSEKSEEEEEEEGEEEEESEATTSSSGVSPRGIPHAAAIPPLSIQCQVPFEGSLPGTKREGDSESRRTQRKGFRFSSPSPPPPSSSSHPEGTQPRTSRAPISSPSFSSSFPFLLLLLRSGVTTREPPTVEPPKERGLGPTSKVEERSR